MFGCNNVRVFVDGYQVCRICGSLGFFYGDSEILYGPEVVVLSIFQSMDKGISRPMHKSVGHLYAWLMRGFKIDLEVQEMTVSIVGNRVREGVYWEVFPLW